jgi:hypothetical protein
MSLAIRLRRGPSCRDTTSVTIGLTSMNDTTPARSREASAEPRASGGLRLRIWLGCLAGALVAGGGIWWVVGTQMNEGPTTDPAIIVSWLGAVAGLGVMVAAAFALWLDHGLVSHARGLTQALATRQIARLRGLPATSGWGELSQLTQQVQQAVSQYRSAERAAEELGLLRDQLMSLHKALARWNETERWSDVQREGPVGVVAESLGRGLVRLEDWRDQNLEVARQIARELELALGAARESSEKAERSFVESTALLTTVRELHRLYVELQHAWEVGAKPAGGAESDVLELAREAIEELVAGSTEAVERLATGLRRVEEMSDQTALLANRATLVALEATLEARSEGNGETRRLVDEIRATVDRSASLSKDLSTSIESATARMHALRERVADKLESLPATPTAAPGSGEEVERLFERVREMVQDATAKGERLSAAGERASRAAESLLRGLESETREVEGLVARLAPVGESGYSPANDELAPNAGGGGLHLLGDADDQALPEADEETR